MKKKLVLMLAIISVLCCLLALGVSAAEPDTSKETVTLADGTVCALWDTEGNPLIWYVKSNVDNVKTYAYVDATSSAVDYNGGYSASTGGVKWYQLSSVKVTVDDVSYDKSKLVVLNLQSDNVKITSGQNIGQHVNCLSKTFTGSTTLEYAYLPLDTVDLNGEVFKNCTALKYVNLSELTELREIGSQDFNLGNVVQFMANQVLDLSNTKITTIATNGFACCSAIEIILPETLTSIGSDVFRNCKFATKITFKGTLTSVSTSNLFNGCQAVEEIVGFTIPAGTTEIGNKAFYQCYKLENAGDFIVDGVMIIPEGVTTVNTFAFSYCEGITYIDMPSTLTTINQQGFSYMKNVLLINFEKITGTLTLGNCGHFRDMDNLVAVSLPEGMVEVNNRAFASCDNLTAVYMPNSVQVLSTNGDGQGAFCGSSKLYFVNESFTVDQCLVDGNVDTSKLVLPEKPTVYYMPTSLTRFGGTVSASDKYSIASMFRFCNALNDVIVFPESFTDMQVTRAFQEIGTKESPKTIVFLGNIEAFALTHYSQYITFIFANELDKNLSDLGIIRSCGNTKETDSCMYFCSTGIKYNLAISGRVSSDQDATTEDSITKINTTIEAIHATAVEVNMHLTNPKATLTTPQTCTTPEGKTYYCFCGVKTGEDTTKDPLGHENSSIVAIVYNGVNKFFDAGDITYHCDRCNSDHEEVGKGKAAAIFVFRGLSAKEVEVYGKAIIQTFAVNREAMKNYNDYSDYDVVGYGLVAATELGLDGSTEIFDNDGNVNTNKAGVVNISAREENFDVFEIKVNGLEGTYTNPETSEATSLADIKVYCCGYCLVQIGGTVASYYASNGVVTETLSGSTSYNELINAQ